MAAEEAEYSVIERDGDFELRQYQPQILAETLVEGDFQEVGNEGFRRLYDYISGKNRKKQSIPMTAPVRSPSWARFSRSCNAIYCMMTSSVTLPEDAAKYPRAHRGQGELQGIIEVSDEPLVSIDYTGSYFSAIIDAPLTNVMNGILVKVMAWYDNEMGFARRMLDMATYIRERL